MTLGKVLERGAALVVVSVVSLITAIGCAGTQVSPEDTDSWRKRGLWVEQEGETQIVNIVGRAENASMGETFVMSTAEQDARARLSIYLGATVTAFRERLARAMANKGKAAGADAPTGGYVATEDNRQGDRTIADNVVRGMETINSFTDKETDTFYVLGRVNLDTLRKVLSASDALSAAEKEFIAANSEVVSSAWKEAADDARSSAGASGG